MSTTEQAPMTLEQIEARLTEIAPPPEWGILASAEGVARYLAVCAMLGFTRNVTPFIRPDQEIPSSLILAQFAAVHALMALSGAQDDDEVAAEIVSAWSDGGEIGERLYGHLITLGVDPDEVARLDAARLALEPAS